MLKKGVSIITLIALIFGMVVFISPTFPVVAASNVFRYEAYNFPGYFMRHANWLGRMDPDVAPVLDSEFQMVAGLADSTCVSFQSVNYPGYYLRHVNFKITLAKSDNSTAFNQSSTFKKVAGLKDSSYVSFQSYNYPTRYIRHSNFSLQIDPISTDGDKQDATFKEVAALTGTAAQVSVNVGTPGVNMSQDLFGGFFEDINHSGDDGLYGELVENRSFDFSTADNASYNSLTGWTKTLRGGGNANISTQVASPLNSNNTSYLALDILNAGTGVGVRNEGYNNTGFNVTKGATYNFSFFAKRTASLNSAFNISIESSSGTVYGQATVAAVTGSWAKYTATITSNTSDPAARLVVLTTGTGSVYMDMISLFPTATFKNRTNGMRADVAQMIADMQPKFLRFPGGCVAHGNSLDNIYKWKDSIGPVEQRKGASDLWGYHQSKGLGFYEFFQLCEDIGAKPLPVVAAGVSCQFASGGQQAIPMAQMPAYVQDILDLIQYANGDINTTWGAQRAAAGHSAPFNLEYLSVGNEDAVTQNYIDRYTMIFNAVKASYPNIKILGGSGPSASGTDFDAGWNVAKSLNVSAVDEHYYMSPSWFTTFTNRYNNGFYSRTGPGVFVGEYASKGNTMQNAISEAFYMTGLERNSDVVKLSCYAPLLCRTDAVNWSPDAIWFNNNTVYGSVNYYVQKMFSSNMGDVYLNNSVNNSSDIAVSSSKDNETGDIILKIANTNSTSIATSFTLTGTSYINPTATTSVLAGLSTDANSLSQPTKILPVAGTLSVASSFNYTSPACSLTVIRIKTK